MRLVLAFGQLILAIPMAAISLQNDTGSCGTFGYQEHAVAAYAAVLLGLTALVLIWDWANA